MVESGTMVLVVVAKLLVSVLNNVDDGCDGVDGSIVGVITVVVVEVVGVVKGRGAKEVVLKGVAAVVVLPLLLPELFTDKELFGF